MSDTLTREVAVRIAGGDGRTLVSRLVPYNEVATVNDGTGPYQEEFLPGAFSAQMRAAHRIKAFLNFRHRQSISDQIGYAKTIEDREDGLHGELRVLENPDGDKALQLVEAGMLDRLSIEFEPVQSRTTDGVVQRVKARLVGVALVPQGAYGGAAVLSVREEDEAEPLPEHTDAPGALSEAHRAMPEPPPPLDLERLERLGIDTAQRAFTTKAWDGSASRFEDTAAYCASCLIDDNPAGEEKTQARCHLPIKEPNGDININAVRDALARVGQVQSSAAKKATARQRLQRLLAQFQNQSGGSS